MLSVMRENQANRSMAQRASTNIRHTSGGNRNPRIENLRIGKSLLLLKLS